MTPFNNSLVIEHFSSGNLGIPLGESSGDQGNIPGNLGLTLDEYDPDDPLRQAFEQAERITSPIVLDLDGNGIATRSVADGSFFDYDGNGFAERTGWATSGDGLLVRDLNGDGIINNGTELFGDRTLLKSGETAANGFYALADLDDNRDGRLDSHDAAWSELRIWQDRNSDGITDAGELTTLDELGIAGIATGFSSTATTDSQGNQHLQQGWYTKTDGSSGRAEDIWFAVDLASTRNENPLELSDTLRALPELNGRGNVASLRQVMAQQAADGSNRLHSLVEQLGTVTDPVARNALVTQIIYVWAGVEDEGPASRGGIDDVRKLAAMERFVGEAYTGGTGNNASTILLNAFSAFASDISAQLLWQTLAPMHIHALRETLFLPCTIGPSCAACPVE